MTTSTAKLLPPATAPASTPAPVTTAKPPPPVAERVRVPELISDGIFYPETDGEPLPDGEYQAPIYQEVVTTLATHFRSQPRTRVNGNTFIYYERGNPRRFVSPDCYVAFDVDVDIILHYNTYRIWEVGKAPDFILEIASETTADADLGRKRRIYARIGARESWRYDATGGDYYGYPLAGDAIDPDGEITSIEIHYEPDGMVWGHSAVLGLDLCWDQGRLRFYDPIAGEWLRNFPETEAELTAERNARTAAESRANIAEIRVADAEEQLVTERNARATAESRADVADARVANTESRLAAERAARADAEARAAQLEAELRQLRGEAT